MSYNPTAIALAGARGYDEVAHLQALADGDEDAISLTHPYNFLTELEVEYYSGDCRWFLLCENRATTTVKHPVLGDVPTCQTCADKVARL